MNARHRAMSLVPATLLLGAVLAATACRGQEPAAERAPARPHTAAAASPQARDMPRIDAIPFTPPPPAYAGELPPLPMNPYPAPRPQAVIQAVYTFAARHPEVLHYVPCFCGCQRSGHRDNDDCFIQRRERDGRPIWEPHGMT
jgi:hypothetical protein